MSRRFLLALMISMLLIGCLSSVYATTTTLVLDYTDINGSYNATTYVFGNYSTFVTTDLSAYTYNITVTHDMVFNAKQNTTSFVSIAIDGHTSNTASPSVPEIIFSFYENGKVSIYCSNSTADFYWFCSALTQALPYTLTISNGTNLRVTDTGTLDKNTTMVSPFAPTYVHYKHNNATDSAILDSGTITFETTYSEIEASNAVIQTWLPTILSFAMLGVVLGMLEKTQKR
jgi:hypothetical protein